jgi:DNA invertase Pin-like site-specific DNA recombinase
MNCAIYTRISTDNQAEKKYNSCEAQEEKINAYIKSQEGLKLYKVYSNPQLLWCFIRKTSIKRDAE